MMYYLTGYVSPSDRPPTFVIPIFSKPGSNAIFAQDLDLAGNVKAFKALNCDLFYAVHVLAPAIGLSVGSAGLIAYWSSPSRVLVGSSNSIVELIGAEIPDDPFADLEIGSLLGEADRVSNAVGQIAIILNDNVIAKRWKLREIETYQNCKKIVKLAVSAKNSVPSESEKSFQKLISTPEEDDWAGVWLVLWNSNYKRRDLERVALWWIESGYGAGENLPGILEILLRRPSGRRVDRSALDWLMNNSISSRSWPSVWNAARYGKGEIVNELTELALQKLDAHLSSADRTSNAWSLVWSWLWRTGKDRNRLASLAESMAGRNQNPGEYFGEYVLYPLVLNSALTPISRDASIVWLSHNIKSKLLWANMFNRLFRQEPSNRLVEVGGAWLRFCGGNTNKWQDIWKQLTPTMSKSQAFETGFEWLKRARWDLSSWPVVFNELVNLVSDISQAKMLVVIGRRWSGYDENGIIHVSKISQGLRYLGIKWGDVAEPNL